ncbi:MAG: hypothetical protein IT458_02715 [Planctomycetes bacterium]|nr:hypothetical protein [Planctomycetota bacterium]
MTTEQEEKVMVHSPNSPRIVGCSVLLCLCLPAPAQETATSVPATRAAAPLLGAAPWLYAWQKDFGRLPGGRDLGNTHGCMVVDRAGRIFANTDTEQAVVIFGPDGEVLGSWGKEYRGGLHGMTLRVEDGVEYLYLVHTTRHEVLKTSLDGKVLWTLGWPEASGIYGKEGEFRPTSVAVGPDGRIFVADGYGKSWVHLYDRDRRYVKSFAGPGTEPGRTRTPHGLWIDTRGAEPLLLVCDRENHRLQWFTMQGEFVRVMDQNLRRPCNVWPLEDGALAVADLAGRVTLLDRKDALLVHLGDNPDPNRRARNGVPRDQWQDGHFLAPHSVCADARGDLYVMDWNAVGRITKLRRMR